MRIVITGASGQLGQSFFHWKDKFPEFTLVPCPRAEMDLSSEEAIRTYFAYNEFDLLINCAAYTHVDGAESNQVMAKQINVHGPSYLAAACVRKKIPILHFSSDYVYHNTLNRPLLETDPTHPESVYGRTKLAGEQEITRHTEEYQIFRSSWIIGPFGNNFLKSMIRLMQERDELKIVEDQIGTPTYSLDMAYDILMMIQNKKHKNYGLYNLSNSGVCSWFDLAMYIRHLGGYSCEVRPITTEEYPAEAERPYYSVMNKSKAKNQLGILLRPWQEAVEEAMKNYFSESFVKNTPGC